MKIRICSVENAKYGKRFYIQYKKLLFWHSVYWDVTPEGKSPVTDWYEPFDLKRYFLTEDEAYEYAEKNLFPTNYKIEKEINFN